MSGQREHCKTFLRVYQQRIDQNLSQELAWASAGRAAGRERLLGGEELEEVRAWLRGKVKTVWRRTE